MIAAILIAIGVYIMIRAGIHLVFMGLWAVFGLGMLYLMFTMDQNTLWLLLAAVIAILLFTRDRS